MVQLLTTLLTGSNSPINTPQPQMQVTIMSDAANAHSNEVLSKVSDNPPIHVPPIINDNPHTRTTDNMHTGFTEPLVSAT